jgi:hypothetical protein
MMLNKDDTPYQLLKFSPSFSVQGKLEHTGLQRHAIVQYLSQCIPVRADTCQPADANSRAFGYELLLPVSECRHL